jgi:hypothetical protein
MKIHFSIDGGLASFPGLRKPVLIDAAALPPADSARLRQLIAHASPAAPSAPAGPPAPDARCYTLAIDDGGACTTLKLTEPIADPALRELVAELSAHATGIRSQQGGSA